MLIPLILTLRILTFCHTLYLCTSHDSQIPVIFLNIMRQLIVVTQMVCAVSGSNCTNLMPVARHLKMSAKRMATLHWHSAVSRWSVMRFECANVGKRRYIFHLDSFSYRSASTKACNKVGGGSFAVIVSHVIPPRLGESRSHVLWVFFQSVPRDPVTFTVGVVSSVMAHAKL